jgi:signal transduction histidine kinase
MSLPVRTAGGRDVTLLVLWLFSAVAIVFGLTSAHAARAAKGMVVSGLFLDPFCTYSAVPLPGLAPPPLRYPDRLAALDGQAVDSSSRVAPYPSAPVDARIASLHAAGARAVALEFARGRERLRVVRPLVVLGATEVVYFWALYFIAGLLVAWSGMVVLAVSHKAAAARAYAISSVATFVFLATFFDYHTTRRFIPLFSSATVWLGAGCLWLALHFPEPPRQTAAARALTFTVGGASFALWVPLVVGPWLSLDVLPCRVIASLYAPVAASVLAVTLFVRNWYDKSRDRRQIAVALAGMLATLVAVFVGIVATLVLGSTAVHSLMPLIIPLTPLSIGWALVRHNLLDADLVLTRRLLVVPSFAFALGVALAAWLALRIALPVGMEVQALLVAAFTFAAFVFALRRLSDRVLFPATREFRPTIQLLAESLTGISRQDELHAALRAIVTRWLPTGAVRVLAPQDVTDAVRLSPDDDAKLQQGRAVWTQESPRVRHLLVPMCSQGVFRGAIDIAPKHFGALFTEEDFALLRTISALGAIALHNVAVVTELDATRRFELDVSRREKRLALGLLGAELSHEIAHPLQFFKGLLNRGAKRALDEDDVEIGQEEIGRMQRMLASLRSLESPALRRAPVALAEPVSRSVVLLRELLSEKRVRCEIEVPAGCSVLADADGLVQVFSNLLRNAVQAVAVGGAVGVRSRSGDDGALQVDVWDDGPGVPDAMVPTLFHRWVTSRSADGGSGLGLSVARDLVVTSFDWQIDYAREDGLTRFRITVPPRDVAVTLDDTGSSKP